MCCKCCSVLQQKIWMLTFGILFTLIGILLAAGWPKLARHLINQKLPLSPDSYLYKKWITTPIDVYTIFYLYNWTNPEEYNNPKVKPNFVEHGPYAFLDYKVKEDLIWDDANNLVTFYGRRTFKFVEKHSNGSLDDLITIPHFPTMTLQSITSKYKKVLKKIVNFFLNREGGSLTVTHRAIDHIFNGYYDRIFDFVEQMHSPFFPINSNHFAYYYGRNNSKEADGRFTIHTGNGDLGQLGDLKLYNGKVHTGHWADQCGTVNGSTGELWTMGKKFNEVISIFITDAARYFNLFPIEKRSYKGIKEAWLYKSTEQTFDSGHIAPDTKCFCVKGHECPKRGVIDFAPVLFNGPFYISHRQFYMADPSYLENTTGLNPNADEHGIYIIMEPQYGIPLEMNGQVLVSLYIERDENIDLLKDVAHNFYAPLFTLQIKAEMSDELIEATKFVLAIPYIGQYIGFGLIVLGFGILVVALWLHQTNRWYVPNRDCT